MKNHLLVHGVFASLLAIASLTSARADDSVVALGVVASNGALVKSANSVAGVVATSRTAQGKFEVTVTAPGAFAGAALDDFTIEATVRSLVSDDNLAYGRATVVSDDVLTVSITTTDPEDATSPDLAVVQDSPFYFLIRTVPAGNVAMDGESRFLVGVGKVSSVGVLNSGFGVDGVVLTTSQTGTGEYAINLTKADAFVGDETDDYVLILCPFGGGFVDDETVRGGAASVASDDAVLFEVLSDDVQQAVAGNVAVPTDESFTFAIYRLTGTETNGESASRLVLAAAAVESNGDLDGGAIRFGEGTLTTSNPSVGNFFHDLVSAGAFAGAADSRFVAQAFVRSSGLNDEVVNAGVFVVDDNTLRVSVMITDVQAAGESTGNFQDHDHVFVVYDTDPEFGPDLSIGTKKTFSTLKGRGVQNANGAGQGIKLSLTGTAERKFFLAAENAGHSLDGIRLKGIGTAGPLNTTFFRTTGGKTNVTAEVKTGAVVADEVRPGEIIRFEGRTAYKSATARPTKTIKVRGLSGLEPASIDLVKAAVVAK
jgi:hypothetical protein